MSDGPNIKQLNHNLVALGFDADHQITVNSTRQDPTSDAIERWQASLDQTQTGSIPARPSTCRGSAWTA